MRYTRRAALRAVGAAGGAGLAGCLGDPPVAGDPGGDDDGGDSGNGDGSDPAGSETGPTPTDVSVDVYQLGAGSTRPLWRVDEDATGFVALIDAEDDRPWMADVRADDELAAWLEETDFSRSAIVYVETAAPNACYDAVEVRDGGVEDGAITAVAEAVDTSDGSGACAQAVTFPGALVRVTGEGADVPGHAEFEVVDGWGGSGGTETDGMVVHPSALPGAVSPADDPRQLAEPTCDDPDFEHHAGPQEAVLGETESDDRPTFAMRVHAGDSRDDDHRASPRVGRGEEVRVTMHNLSTAIQYTGNRHKWNLQVLTADGWLDVRGWPDGEPRGYTDEGVAHRPGEGFEWRLEMTESGVLEGHVHEDRLAVCPDLQPGRYRFCFREADRSALAVEFDYEG